MKKRNLKSLLFTKVSVADLQSNVGGRPNPRRTETCDITATEETDAPATIGRTCPGTLFTTGCPTGMC